MARLDFDSEGKDTRDPFEVLPDNTEVIAELVQSEMKATSAGDGHYLSCEFVVVEEENQGRKFFENLNLDNKNEQAVKIAERKLALLCQATGKLKVADSEELHGIPVCLVLGVQAAKGDFPARNTIKSIKPAADKGKKLPRAGAKASPSPSVENGAASSAEKPKAAPWART